MVPNNKLSHLNLFSVYYCFIQIELNPLSQHKELVCVWYKYNCT